MYIKFIKLLNKIYFIIKNKMTSESNSSSTYSNSITNNNNNSTDPFSSNSYQNRSYGNSLSNYEINSQGASVSNKIPKDDDDYFVLSNSRFTLSVNYKKGQNEANVVYKDITYTNKNGEINKTNIDIVKKYKPDKGKMKISYPKFVNFIDNVENVLKAEYKKEKEIEIILKITKYNSYNDDYLKCDCKFIINDGRDEKDKENEFTEEDFLNKYIGDGLGVMIASINEE